MLDYQVRVVEEKEALDEKLTKLGAFLETESMNKLDKDNQWLLQVQYQAMRQYSMILNERIKLF